jgi:hypothetical protein
MEPTASAVSWFESAPDPIDDDAALAVLIAQLGMASNILSAHIEATFAAQARADGKDRLAGNDVRDMFCSVANTAATLFESIVLAGKNMALLRILASKGGASVGLFERVGKLQAGKHPASRFLDRARNQLVFHWDEKTIAASVQEFARNQKIVWLELDQQQRTLHVFALHVLIHALFPGTASGNDPAAERALFGSMLQEMADAAGIILQFFAAAVAGYMKEYNVERKMR